MRLESKSVNVGPHWDTLTDPGEAWVEDRGLMFADGRCCTAFRNLAAPLPLMATIGGSHTQCNLFDPMTDAGLRAGRNDATSATLRDRLKQRGGHMDRPAATRFDTLNTARGIAAQLPDFLHL